MKRLLTASLLALSFSSVSTLQAAPLLNVSYDVMRDFYKEYNPAFQQHWQAQGNKPIQLQMSHGGSSKQARSVIDGLPADVITMNMATDINALHEYGDLIPENWAERLPDNSAPFTSATVLIVRKGNPKNLQDWPDLLKEGVQVIVPNPKTSGNGRYTYLSAWAYVLKNGGSEQEAKEFVGKLFKQAPVLDTGGRAATSTFMQNQIGDVLVTFENEAEMIAREFGSGAFEVVYPSVSAEAEPPVAIVDKVVDRKGSRAVAEAYLNYLWSDEAQRIAANNYLRPRNQVILAEFSDRFPEVDFMPVEETFGSWPEIQKTHFNDGGVFDQVYADQQ
ncbi:sulfate ABC transporter substrate-binding protein [Denitrificimonas caeni]|uniref:Sulfate ABC transporter substrate-binding protein n=1 Tax=Denitrificimonas caeni TaxID=521720 RepID=A0AAF0AIE0_9GAMM|nr:sulfate ABC transporter substrate-binding protein [Denitrificimonas caeni]NLJ12401.1 sulfate ABC transporter substrate-binding protein [Gammaproteobacteria bacterium]WBE24909.1 sulfate ABC transporter substrate-binding protein [Denitrificimonas caeni]